MVDFDSFVDWAEGRFGDVRISGDYVRVNSPFDPDGDDRGHKLYCNPSLDGHRYGSYHCFKSGEKGTLLGLVMDLEGVGFEEACNILKVSDPCDWTAAIEALLGKPAKASKKQLSLPEGLVPAAEHPGVRHYLATRKIGPDGLYAGVTGDFRDRVVIPYYDRKGELIYYNARAAGKQQPRYLGPPGAVASKGDVVFLTDHNSDRVYLTEGEFDALTLKQCGLAGGAVAGSHLSPGQRDLLGGYQVTLCPDQDAAGYNALFKMGKELLQWGFQVNYVRPPIGYKDWNELYKKFSGDKIKDYILKHEKEFQENTIKIAHL